MNDLPKENELNIEQLSSCFNETTNSYKFYWFWAILNHINESEEMLISLDEISLRMISLAWYPLDFYKLSFGKQDSFKPLAQLISKYIQVDNRPSAPDLFHQLNSYPDKKEINHVKREINLTLKRWVAFRFLRPFFKRELKGVKDQNINREIERLTTLNKSFTPYYFANGFIILNHDWKQYFLKHQLILRGFIKWNLLKFLQRNNPNAIGLSEKIVKPSQRNLGPAKQYWQTYLSANPTYCIYRNELLDPGKISLDHFVPWSYVVHDQIWNIIPTTKSTNSKKSDYLPNTELFLEKMCKLQFKALTFHLQKTSNSLVEDFYAIGDVVDLADMNFENFRDKLSLELNTHIRNAKNMGFIDVF